MDNNTKKSSNAVNYKIYMLAGAVMLLTAAIIIFTTQASRDNETVVPNVIVTETPVAATESAIVLENALNQSAPISDESLRTRELFTAQNYYNMTVVVVFDAEEPPVQFIDPAGNRLDMASVRSLPGGNFIQYFLPNAMPGTWSMEYALLTNSEISAPYSVYMEHLAITGFGISGVPDENGIRPVHFTVESDEPNEIQYEIYVVLTAEDNSIVSEVRLAEGTTRLNQSTETAVDTSEFEDDGFMLRLQVWRQYGQAAVRDTSWLDFRN